MSFVVLVLTIGAIVGFGSSWLYAMYLGHSSTAPLDVATALWIMGGTGAVIVAASAFKLLTLGGDGGRIAESLGATEIVRGTSNLQQQRFLNIVEEMAIAARMPVPRVYVVKHERGINAFAAGSTPERAAIAVTHGALAMLSRDELSAVVAHEMAHVANADTRLNGRLLALVFGLVAITTIGRIVVQSAPRNRSTSSNKGNVMAFVLMVGVLLLVLGALGALAGRILQSMVSRRRELLADASAVQFTRDPDALARALKKIGAASRGSRIGNAHAEEAQHMFFASSAKGFAGLLATHPPLEMRIRLLDPDFSPSRDALWNGDERTIMRSIQRETAGPWGSVEETIS